MKKSELIEALAQDQGLPTKTAASIVNTISGTPLAGKNGAFFLFM